MRMRKKRHGAERIAACAELLIQPPCAPDAEPAPPADPQSWFPVPRPLHLEIGCGKGDFAVGMAAAHPDCNWIAMERVADVACLALEKAMRQKDTRPDNLRFLIGDARRLAELFPAGSVDCLYLNFSDPWPKSGHARRRLTHPDFLRLYRLILRPNGLLRMKTDNRGLFDYSLEQFAAFGMTVEFQTTDLHHSDHAQDNIMTEYERSFSGQGQAICSVWARFGTEGTE